jgi:GR25 family glycosyltransferase involved in LPS biosynthesis
MTTSFKCWDYIDAVYYINLEHRTDRLVEIEAEFDKVKLPFSKRFRVSAERTPECGALGCCMSHVKTLRSFLETGNKNCIIFEDDFQFIQEPEFVNNMICSIFDMEIKFDIVMLSGNIFYYSHTNIENIHRVFDGQTTSGYLITREFAFILLEHWEKTAKLTKKYLDLTGQHLILLTCDQTWKVLQPVSQWFVFYPKLGIQRESYSDIEGSIMNYKT